MTFSKSSPFATICVPTMISYSPAENAANFFSSAYLFAVVSVSMRRIRASGKASRSWSSAFCVPPPEKVISVLPQAAQRAFAGSECPQ